MKFAKGLKTQTPILVYHDVVSKRNSKSVWFDCTIAEFIEQLDWLTAQGAEFISTQELLLGLTGKKEIPKNAVVITFADNYAGFFNLAWPELKKRNIPVTQFIHTNFVGSNKGRPKMSWNQLKELAMEPLITLASQTLNHPKLCKLSDQQLHRELEGSKQKLEDQLKRPCDFLAYPDGAFDKRVVAFAKKAGYKMAFTETQVPAEKTTDLLTVSRYVHTKWKKAWQDGIEKKL